LVHVQEKKKEKYVFGFLFCAKRLLRGSKQSGRGIQSLVPPDQVGECEAIFKVLGSVKALYECSPFTV